MCVLSRAQVAWDDLLCWRVLEEKRTVHGFAGVPTVDSISERMMVKKGLLPDITSLKWGKQLNDNVVNALARGALKYAGCDHRVTLVDSLITPELLLEGPESRNRSVAAFYNQPLHRHTVGILHVGSNHWVAFSLTARRGDIAVRVFDSSADVYSKTKYRYNQEPGSSEGDACVVSQVGSKDHIELPGYADRIYLILSWYCQQWSLAMGTTLEVEFVGTAQQLKSSVAGYAAYENELQDGWSCGRWAVANLIVLIYEEYHQNRVDWPVDLTLVQGKMLKLMEMVACAP